MNETVFKMLAIITFKGFEFKLFKSKSKKVLADIFSNLSKVSLLSLNLETLKLIHLFRNYHCLLNAFLTEMDGLDLEK
jgi:hypothetical protein